MEQNNQPRELTPNEAKLLRMIEVLKKDLANKTVEIAELRVLFDDAMAHNRELMNDQEEPGAEPAEAAGGE